MAPFFHAVCKYILASLFLLMLGRFWSQAYYCNALSTMGFVAANRIQTRGHSSFTRHSSTFWNKCKMCKTNDDCLETLESKTEVYTPNKLCCSSSSHRCVTCGWEETCMDSSPPWIVGAFLLIIVGIVAISCFCCTCCPGYMYLKDRRERNRIQEIQYQMAVAARMPAGSSSVWGSTPTTVHPLVTSNGNTATYSNYNYNGVGSAMQPPPPYSSIKY